MTVDEVEREPGYYWTQMPTDNAPEVREWQIYCNRGFWAECGDGDRFQFPGLIVISERLEPPE